MASPAHIPAASRSDSPPLMETCDKENICQGRDVVPDCLALHREGAVSTKKKKKPAGFNLRKSIAWNPAFFTEEGVLDNMELTMLSGSQMKPSRSPGSGVGGATVSPLCRFGRSGSTSVLKEVTENSRAKLPARFRSTENKGRKLFSPAKTCEQDERRELADKRSAKSIQKCIPRPSAGNAQKNVPNSSATSQMFRTPKKSQPPIPMVPRSTPSSTNMSKPNKRLPPVKTEHPRRAEGLQLNSKVKPTSLTKPSGPNIEKDVAPAVTAIHEEASASRNCESFSIYSQNRPSVSYGVPASTFAKPSALRMPSPSLGFFAQGKASVTHGDTAQGSAKSYLTGNTSSLVKPPRYKQPEDLKGRLFQDRLSNGYSAQGNAKSCFTGNTSSLVKPPRYKQPEDLKGRLSLTKQLLTNSPAALKLPVHPVTNESTLNTLASSSPGLEHANVCSARLSLSIGVITDLAKSGNMDNQQARKVDCFSAGSGATTQPLRPEKNDGSRNGVPAAYSDASHVEERGIINRIEPIEDPHSLKAICSSTIEPVEDYCSHEAICSSTVGGNMSSSCMSSQVCTLDDLNCQSKSDDCASVATDLENSLIGETTVTVSLSDGNNCIPGPGSLQDFDSSNQQNTAECSTLMEPVKSTIYADRVPQCGSSIDITPALAESASDLYGSLCHEVQPTSSEEPNTDDQMEFDPDNSLIAPEAQLLHVGCEGDHDYRSTECPSMEQAEPMPCVDQETQATDLSDLKAVTIDSKTEPDDSLAVERQPVLLEEPHTEDDMELDTNGSSALEDASPIEKNKAVNKPGTNTILKGHLKHLVPFTEEWLAAMEACGEEVLEQKTGAVQNSPTDKTAPEPSPWSPVKRKAQDVGPFDCTKYSKSVRTSDTP